MFQDLQSSSNVFCQENYLPLHICEDKVLGKGGFGFVCKGEIQKTRHASSRNVIEYVLLKVVIILFSLQPGTKKNVAVKVFLKDIKNLYHDNTSITKLLEVSKEPKHLIFAYKQIRQEVSFLSNLSHPNLTKLCGVRTSPYMCLMLELAPKKSLRVMLKQYKDYGQVLEPLTLKATARQVSII